MGKKSFVIEVDKCSGCQLCVIACKDEHVGNDYAPWTRPQPETGQFWMRLDTLERGRIPRVRMTYLPILCQHCTNAPCMKACPEGAIKRRDDDLVWIDSALCNGSGLCKEACPYDVIYMNEELAVAQKCTGCAHRVDEGLSPRCVEICPHDAIVFADEMGAGASNGSPGEALFVYHPEYQTRPKVYWKGLPKPWIAGMVIDAASDEVIPDVTITSVDLFEDRIVAVQSDEFGDFWLRALENDRKYKIEIRKNGYDDVFMVVTTDRDQDLGTIALKKTTAGRAG
jgi:tetrathionate reductase subunit B